MLCNCYELHNAHAKDLNTTKDYAHDHKDGWDYYHFRNFSYQPWTRVPTYIEDDEEKQYPRIVSETRQKIVASPNGTCDPMTEKTTEEDSSIENINEQFSGSLIATAKWEQLDENRISLTGTETIGFEESSGGSVGVAELNLKGSQQFAVSIGSEASNRTPEPL